MTFTKDQLLSYLQNYLKTKGDKIVFKSYYFNVYKNVIRDHPLVYKARISNDYTLGTPFTVNPRALRPTQSTVDVKNLIGLLNGRSIPETDSIAVARVDGKLYIINGHHRVWIATNLGESSISCYLYDIDAYDKKVDSDSHTIDAAPSKPPQGKAKTPEDIANFGKALIQNGVYQIDIHSKYDTAFWSKWGRDDVVMEYLTGKIEGEPGTINVSTALSLEDRSINVSHLIKVASGAINEKVVAFKYKSQYWVIDGFTSVYIAQRLNRPKIQGFIIEIDK